MAALNPWDFIGGMSIWIVVRPNPIRVAGNSGPLKGETTWEALGLEPEYTTVTKKMRRVGVWDPDLVRQAVQANGANRSHLVMSMMDHKFPELAAWSEDVDYPSEVRDWIRGVEQSAGCPIELLLTGPNSAIWRRYGVEGTH
jgi:adenylosuccinate synthase